MIELPGAAEISSLLLNNALNTNSLDHLGLDLRNISAGSRAEKIQRVASQFEEILLQQMIKSMSASEENNNEESMGFGMRMYKDLRNMYLSQYVADSGGLGYRQLIQEQIEKLYGQPAMAVPEFSLAPSAPVLPVQGKVTSAFGWRQDPIDGKRRFHQGVDFRIAPRSPVHSVMAGVVTFSGWRENYGQVVEIRHANGLVSRYAHNDQVLVQSGQKVAAGTVVAFSGDSGRSTGPHLHFEVLREGVALDPVAFLAQKPVNVFKENADLSGEAV